MIGVACSGKNKQTNKQRAREKEAPPSTFLRQVFFSLID